MVVEKYGYSLYGEPDTLPMADIDREAGVDNNGTRWHAMGSLGSVIMQGEAFADALNFESGDYRGDFRADVDGDGMISSWDQLRFAQQQTAWVEVFKAAAAIGSSEADEGWPVEGNLSKFHPQRQQASGEPLSDVAPPPVNGQTQLSPRAKDRLRGLVELDNRLGFAGYVWDPFLKLYHVRHRVFHPGQGVWMQRDPIGYAGGMNLYEYCEGDPLNRVDPMGLDWDGGWITEGLGGLLGFYGTAPLAAGLQGAHDGLLVTANSAARNITFGYAGETTEGLAQQGVLYDAENSLLMVSDVSGQAIGECVKLIALAGLAQAAQCGTLGGRAIQAGLELKAAYERAEGAADTAELIFQMAEMLEAGDYEGARALAIERGAKILIEQLAAKVTQKLADGIPCFAEGTPVQTECGPVAIESLQPGDRVMTGIASDGLGASSIDPATWRLFTLELGSGGERKGMLQILRPATWLGESFSHTDANGTWVRLVVAEWGLDGLAMVRAVAPCPEMKPGSGRIVLMKSTTRYTGEMAKLTLAGVAAPLEGTAGHPIFSEDRGDYVPMGDLMPGERVRTADGWATVESLSRTWTAGATVYNLEVEGEHRFLAGFGRVVSHNAGPCNGNKRTARRDQHAYDIRDTQTINPITGKGDVVKNGISGQPINCNGSSPRANPQVNKLNKLEGYNRYESELTSKGISGRKRAVEFEKLQSELHRQNRNSLRFHQRP